MLLWPQNHLTFILLVSDIAVFVLKTDIKPQPTNQHSFCSVSDNDAYELIQAAKDGGTSASLNY